MTPVENYFQKSFERRSISSNFPIFDHSSECFACKIWFLFDETAPKMTKSPSDLVRFTEEILDGKLHLLSGVIRKIVSLRPRSTVITLTNDLIKLDLDKNLAFLKMFRKILICTTTEQCGKKCFFFHFIWLANIGKANH